MSVLSDFQKATITRKKTIERTFLFFELLMPVLWGFGAYVLVNYPDQYLTVFEIGGWFGILSFSLYCLTLVPGILKRFQKLPLVQATIMPFRRHLGILMFLTAYVHMGYVGTIPIFFANPPVTPAPQLHILYGFLTMMLLFPLWLTSNDFTQKRMGRVWKWVHRLTYLALGSIILHVSITSKPAFVVAVIFIGLEIASWGKVFLSAKKTPTVSQ